MINSNVLAIGSVAKHCGEYDNNTTYYYTNVITMFGSMFQALGNNFSGMPPLVEATDGTVSLANTNLWLCLIDNVSFYNFKTKAVIDANNAIDNANTAISSANTALETANNATEAANKATDAANAAAEAANTVAETVEGKVDDYYKKSNYNDGDDIIDFNTIHLVEDNPEYIAAWVDADERLLVGIKKDTGSPYYGVGVPEQVKDYIDAQINKILGTDDVTSTIDSLKELEAFLKDFSNSDTLKELLNLKADVTALNTAQETLQTDIDDKYKKSNPNDGEGNVVDTNTIVSVEDNPEYIKAITDSVGKLIEAIGLDGVRKFFAGIDVQGVRQNVVDNPEYIAVWTDSDDKLLLAIENDGNVHFGYGVPKQVEEFAESLNTAINTKIDDLAQALEDAKTDIDKKINFGDSTYPADVHEISENPEYISVVLDAAQRILEAYGVDGVKRLFTAIELMGTRMSVEDNPEFIKVDVDKDDKILGGFKVDGDYVFGAGVPTQIQVKTKEIADNLDTANAIELDSDTDGNIYASTGQDGNITVSAADDGTVYMEYDTDNIDIVDAYEEEDGSLIVEQNKVMTL